MDTLIKKHDRWWDITPMEIVRQWAQSINRDARLLSIRGPKGVGKSTMMRQYIKQHYAYMDRQVLCNSYAILAPKYFIFSHLELKKQKSAKECNCC